MYAITQGHRQKSFAVCAISQNLAFSAKFSLFCDKPRKSRFTATNRDILHFPRYMAISCSFLIGNFGGNIDQRSSGPMGINRYKWGSVVTNGDQSLQMGINRYKSEDQSL